MKEVKSFDAGPLRAMNETFEDKISNANQNINSHQRMQKLIRTSSAQKNLNKHSVKLKNLLNGIKLPMSENIILNSNHKKVKFSNDNEAIIQKSFERQSKSLNFSFQTGDRLPRSRKFNFKINNSFKLKKLQRTYSENLRLSKVSNFLKYSDQLTSQIYKRTDEILKN